MSQKLYDNVWNIGGQTFAIYFAKDPVFYRMMSPFYVEANKQINSLGFPGIPASAENYGKVLQFAIEKHRLLDSLSNAYFQQPEVIQAFSILEPGPFGGFAYYGDVSILSPTAKIFVNNMSPSSANIRLAMWYGFLHYAIQPVSDVYKKFLIDEPEVSFRATNPIEHFQQAFSVVASGYLNAIGPEGIAQTFSGFGKPIAEQNWNPVTAPFQLANSLEGLITGAVILGATAATGSLSAASAEAAAAAPATTAGTTLAEVTVTAGAPAAAAGGGGALSTVTAFLSENATAAVATAGAALESEAKKRVQDAIVGALQPKSDAIGDAPAAEGESAIPKVVLDKSMTPYLFAAGLAGLLYVLN